MKAIDDSNSPNDSINFIADVDPDGKTKLIEHLRVFKESNYSLISKNMSWLVL